MGRCPRKKMGGLDGDLWTSHPKVYHGLLIYTNLLKLVLTRSISNLGNSTCVKEFPRPGMSPNFPKIVACSFRGVPNLEESMRET